MTVEAGTLGRPRLTDLTHLDEQGHARMVDVAERAVTTRTAAASGRVTTTAAALIRSGTVPKGDVLAVARVAGIMAAKRTPDLIPLCHPIAVHGVDADVRVAPDRDEVLIRVTVRTADRTGVEMEALTAVAAAGLSVIDMVKAIDPQAALRDVLIEVKDGGRNGHWQRPGQPDPDPAARTAPPRPLVGAAPVSEAQVRAEIRGAAAGAVVTFSGVVRDHDHDRGVTALHYEGHPDAARVLAEILTEARARPGVLAAAARHRVGDLVVGDLAFVAAVSAAHRGEAFAACAWLVDQAKARLPIGKHQHFTDGTDEWVNSP